MSVKHTPVSAQWNSRGHRVTCFQTPPGSTRSALYDLIRKLCDNAYIWGGSVFSNGFVKIILTVRRFEGSLHGEAVMTGEYRRDHVLTEVIEYEQN